MKNHTVYVLDDDESVREMIVECLRFSDFDARGYGEAEKLLADILAFDTPNEGAPDSIVVDLQLESGKMQGIELLTELVQRDVPSEILVISGTVIISDLVEAIKMGAAAAIPKPFDIFELVRRMESMAETGRKRRLFRLRREGEPSQMDGARLVRPLFLSYADKNKRLAMGLRRNLEAKGIPVWYAPTTAEIGDEWREQVEQGIDQATIFVALVTDHYIASPYCLGELTRFYRRMGPGHKADLLIIPVLDGISEAGRRHPLIRPILEKYHYLDLSERFVDGLTALLGRVQRALAHQVYGDFAKRATAGHSSNDG